MAIRTIRTDEDPLLKKKSREVKEINDRITTLLDDMLETMYDADGVGIAAPQVGILRRAIALDVGDGPLKLINPEIIDQEGSEIDVEGCLSVPNFNGTVERPAWVKVRYLDENGEQKEVEATGLFARCLCHEIDHLDGILFTDKYIDEITREELVEARQKELEEIEEDVEL